MGCWTQLRPDWLGGLGAAFKPLADPVRLRLLSLSAAAPDGAACSCDLEPLSKSQPTVSHHPVAAGRGGLITMPERLAALRDVLGA